MQCDVTRIICISSKVDKEQLQKFYQRRCIVISSDLYNAIKKIMNKMDTALHCIPYCTVFLKTLMYKL